MATKINVDAINNAVLANKGVKEAAKNVAETRFNKALTKLKERFAESKITQEIKAGPNAKNTSGTLGGYGNLYSFIGFESDPVQQVLDSLNQIRFDPVPINISRRSKVAFFYGFDGPGLFEILKNNTLPWLPGRSWLTAVEQGISNLGNYINKNFRDSRSGAGIQIKGLYRAASYKPQPYFQTFWNEFIASIERG